MKVAARINRGIYWISLSILVILLIVAGCAKQQKKVLLKMKFVDGRELVYEQINKQTIKVRNSPEVSQSSQSKGEMMQVVRGVTPTGTAMVEETSTWSWSEPASDSGIEVVSTSESLSYEMSPNGKIGALRILSSDSTENSRWKEYAQQNLEQSQPTFPEEEVGKGYTWMQSVKIFMPTGEALDASTTYEVKDFVETDGHKCVVIDYKGNLVLPFDVMESDSLTRRGVDRVDVTGTLVFDYENGYTFSQLENTKITAERSKIEGNTASSNTFYIDGELFFHLKDKK